MMLAVIAGGEYRTLGIGLLMAVGAIVAGYLVAMMVPRAHFPSVAGILASNVVIGGFAAANISPAAYMIPWIIFSLFALRAVFEDFSGK